jgi:hypothetical protein
VPATSPEGKQPVGTAVKDALLTAIGTSLVIDGATSRWTCQASDGVKQTFLRLGDRHRQVRIHLGRRG